MTIASETTFAGPYEGDGADTTFTFSFYAQSASDITVYVAGSVVTAYSISFNSGNAGGTVTFDSAPASGADILIVLDFDATQDTAFADGGFNSAQAATLQTAVDRVDQNILQVKRAAIVWPETAMGYGYGNELPAPSASGYLRRNADNDGWEFANASGTITSATTPSLVSVNGYSGSTDIAKLTAAWAAGHRRLRAVGMSFDFDDGDTLTSTGEDVYLEFIDCTFNQNGDDELFILLGGWDNIQAVSAITADDGDGMPTYTVPSTTTIKSGHVMKIVDEQNLVQMTSRKQGEFGVVRTVPSGTTFTFSKTTRLAYSTGSTCRVAKLNTAKIVCDFSGSRFDSPRGDEAGSGKMPMIVIEAALSPEVRGGDFLYVYNAGVMFQSCYEPSAIGVRGHVAVDGDIDGGSYAGVTVFTSNSSEGLVLGGHQRRGRHYYTSRSNSSISNLGATTLSTYGYDGNHIVAFNKGQGCTTGFLSTHDGSYNIQFIGNIGKNNHKYDLKLRGHKHVVRDHRSENGGVMVGVFVQNNGVDTTADLTIENCHALNMRDGYLSVDANVTGPVTVIGGSDVVESGYTTENSGRMLLAAAITLRVRGKFRWQAANTVLGNPIEMSIAGCTIDIDGASLDATGSTWSNGVVVKDEATGTATHTVKIHDLDIVGGSHLGALYLGTIGSGSGFGAIRADSLSKIATTDTNLTTSKAYIDGPIWSGALAYHPPAQFTNGLEVSAGFVDLAGASEALTIASGAITTTSSYIAVNGEGSLSDDLDTINGASTGRLLIVQGVGGGVTITAKDGTGNLSLEGDFAMNSAADKLVLFGVGSSWIELARANNA